MSSKEEIFAPFVRLRDGWLRVGFGRGRGHGDFHFRWLRSQCDADRHPQTGERTVDSSELPDELAVSWAEVEGDRLRVRWTHDGRLSVYPLGWLEEHAYARDREEVPPPPSKLAHIEVASAGPSVQARVDAALAVLSERGLALVRRSPEVQTPPEAETEGIVAAFAARGLRVVTTHFGYLEDLRTDNTTNQNTDQLGYTDAPIELHTDQPFLQRPPQFQLLQCIRQADAGGDNSAADALAAALYLKSIDARAFELLTTVPIRFHRKQKAFESLVVAPMLDFSGERFQVRSSYFTMAPPRLAFAQMDEWYRAYDRFTRLVRNPAHHYRFALRPGDFLLYDNHRMLHGRTGFRGARWVRGVYFDR